MDNLARYYTQEKISMLLVNKLNTKRPKKILEMAIGDGSLSLAAHKRWKNASYFGIDIDSNSILNVKSNLPFVDIKKQDGLESNIELKLQISNSSIDIAICNPPYLKHQMTEEDKVLFQKVNLNSCSFNNHITTDIIFLAQNLMFLRDGCELGIILPDSILTNHYFKELRSELLENHNIKSIIQLPDNIFTKTEAKTHILIIEKNRKSKKLIEVSKASVNGEIIESIKVKKNDLIHRMDFDYLFWSSKQAKETKESLILKDIMISLTRGNKTKKYLEKLSIPYFHTTSFKFTNSFLELDTNSENFPENLSLAGPGDILIARVGKRCIGNVVMIKKGYIPFTDCIYRLEVPQKYKHATFNALTSKDGQEWLKANAHGVCAQLVSKTDLINFKVR